MAKKFSIRKLLFVGMLSIAGLFGASSIVIDNISNEKCDILEGKAANYNDVARYSNNCPTEIFFTTMSRWCGGEDDFLEYLNFQFNNEGWYRVKNGNYPYPTRILTMYDKENPNNSYIVFGITIPEVKKESWTEIEFNNNGSVAGSNYTGKTQIVKEPYGNNMLVVTTNFTSYDNQNYYWTFFNYDTYTSSTSTKSTLYFAPNSTWGDKNDNGRCLPRLFISFVDGDIYYGTPTRDTTGRNAAQIDAINQSRKDILYCYDNVPLKEVKEMLITHRANNSKWFMYDTDTCRKWYANEFGQRANVFGMNASGDIDWFQHSGMVDYFYDCESKAFISGSFHNSSVEWLGMPSEQYALERDGNEYSLTLEITKEDQFELVTYDYYINYGQQPSQVTMNYDYGWHHYNNITITLKVNGEVKTTDLSSYYADNGGTYHEIVLKKTGIVRFSRSLSSTYEDDELTIDYLEIIPEDTKGVFGGETFYIFDNYGMFNDGSNAHLRVYLRDEVDTTRIFAPVFTTFNGKINNKKVYVFTVPTYTGSSPNGWAYFNIVRCNPTGDSEPGNTPASIQAIWNNYKWNQSDDQNMNNAKQYRSWKATGYSSGTINISYENDSSVCGFNSGEKRYLELKGGLWEHKQSIGIYFFGALFDSEDYHAFVLCDRIIEGTEKENIYSGTLYEYIVPTTSAGGKSVKWRNYIVLELNEGETTLDSDWSNVKRQTDDCTIDSDFNTIDTLNKMRNITPRERIIYFSSFFNNELGATCDFDGNTNYSSLKASWTKVNNQYPIDDDSKNIFKLVDKNENGNELEQAAAKYDYIVEKYGSDSSNINNFANRNVVIRPASFLNVRTIFSFDNGEASFATIVIIIASSISLLSITALSALVIKKRKTKEQ